MGHGGASWEPLPKKEFMNISIVLMDISCMNNSEYFMAKTLTNSQPEAEVVAVIPCGSKCAHAMRDLHINLC